MCHWLKCCCRVRLTVCAVTFLAAVNHIFITNCFTLALTQMVVVADGHRIIKTGGNDEIVRLEKMLLLAQETCPHRNQSWPLIGPSNLSAVPGLSGGDGPRFDWRPEMKGMILSAFFAGFVIMNMPGGQLAQRFGAKPVLLAALAVASMATLLTPWVVHLGGAHALIALRFMIGLSQGGLFPAINVLLTVWVPLSERSRMASLIYCGVPVGMLVGNSLCGMLLQRYAWPIAFYVLGSVGCVFSVLHFLLCSSEPRTHPFISDKERDYLEREIENLERNRKTPLETPWKAILTSTPVLALIVSGLIGEFCNFTLFVFQPIYLNDVLHLSVEDNGFYTAIPGAVYILTSMTCGNISDWLIASGHLSITKTRKLFMMIACLTDGIFEVAVSYGGCNALLVGLFFTVAIGAQGLHTSCTFVNAMDLSPNFVGTISAMLYGLGSCMGIIVPILVGWLAPNSLISEWRVLYWMALSAQSIKFGIFAMWGSAKVQPWNTPALPEQLSGTHEMKQRTDEDYASI